MSHSLKGVGDDEKANYESFTNPTLPLADGLADLIAAFAKRSAGPSRGLPGEDPRPAIEALMKLPPASSPETSPVSEPAPLPDPLPLPEPSRSIEWSVEPEIEALPEPAIKPPVESAPPESGALETIGPQAGAQGGDDASERLARQGQARKHVEPALRGEGQGEDALGLVAE